MPAGRRGHPNKAEMKVLQAKREEDARVVTLLDELPPLYKCTKCGAITHKPSTKFFAVPQNEALSGNENKATLCMECANTYFEEYKRKYNNEKYALLMVCCRMGAYFHEPAYNALHEAEMNDPEKNQLTLGKYFRILNGPQYKKKDFMSYFQEVLAEHKELQTVEEGRDKLEEKWKVADQRNKITCLRAVGYDCFEDESYSSNDRKQMFAALARYLQMPDVEDDKHKLDGAIEIVKTNHQINLINREINKETIAPNPDFDKISRLTQMKKTLTAVINQTAKENGISAGSGYNGKSKSTVAVTQIMKDMIDNGVIEAKVNLTDVKMTEVFQHIANISARSLMNEMNITGDEYAEMVAKQANTVRQLNDEVAKLKEDLRLMTIRAHEAESKNPRFMVNRVEINIGGDRELEELENEELMQQKQQQEAATRQLESDVS